MACILAIETATDNCSVCLTKEGQVLSKRAEKGYIHSSLLAVFIKESLEEAHIKARDLDAVAVSIGPGSYTGLRVGLATAKGICYTRDIPLIAILTLEGLAWQSIQHIPGDNTLHLPMIDARRMEVYVAAYDHQRKQIVNARPLILETSWFQQWDSYDKLVLSGDGSPKVKNLEKVPTKVEFSVTNSDAESIAKIAEEKFHAREFSDIAYLEPEYIKAPNVTKSKKSLL